ncbi:MAG: adenylate/guanylate cyclase domain-containing protein [Spirochaetota bacterium]
MSLFLQNSIAFLLGKHISKDLPKREERAFTAAAMVQILSFSITSFMELISLANYQGQSLAFVHWVDAELLLEMFIAWLLLRNGWHMSAKVLTCISIYIHILWIGFALPNSQIHFFLSGASLIPLILFLRRNRILRIFFVFLPIVLLCWHQYYFRVLEGDAILENLQFTLKAAESMPSLILSQLLFLGLVYHFIHVADRAEDKLSQAYEKSENLLLNILPKPVALELKETGRTKPVSFASASVCFTDFVGFTKIAEKATPDELVRELDFCFSQFDKILQKYNLEKLKTIGDGFMFAGGIPVANETHAKDCVFAALDIVAFMHRLKEKRMEQGLPFWEIRLGIHSGPVIAGVIGEKKFAYDVWGDTVNTASRCESSGMANRVNISAATYELVRDTFSCEYRGEIQAKNKGNFAMYFVNGGKDE